MEEDELAALEKTFATSGGEEGLGLRVSLAPGSGPKVRQ